MSLQAVDVYAVDPDDNFVAGVVINVYNADGSSLITQETTDSDGRAAFLLEQDTTFQLRFFKHAYSFSNPLYIIPLVASLNVFDVACFSLAAPAATDARLCTASGYFRDITGRPLRNTKLTFIPQFKPFLLEDSVVLTGHVNVTTDASGWAQIDLVRFGIYECTMHAKEDYVRCIKIPDQASVSLPDLLLPLVTEITFDPEVPTSYVAGDEDVTVTPTIRWTDGSDGIVGDVQWSSSDPNVLAVLPAGDGSLVLRPLAAGTAEVRAVRADNSIIRIPDPGITGVPITAVVT